jgi:uncharacterized protein YbaP (TraB family)
MMKLASLLALTAAPFALFAASPALAESPAAAPEAVTETGNGPALWQVADEDTTIYLFGTVHILPEGVEWYDPTIASALEGADMIVTEIRMDKESEGETQKIAMGLGVLPPGTTLRSLLNPEQTAAYEAALAKVGMPAGAFDPVKPWLAGLTLSLLPLMKEGFSPDSGVEKVLLAKAGDKPQGALETAESQFMIFNDMTTEAQIAFMMDAVEGVDDVKLSLEQMIDAWIAGDAESLAALMNEGMSDPAVAEALLYKRNANWAEWIDTRLDQPGTVFVAVGAAHLAGEGSVQDYLAAKGIAADRIK